MENLNIISENPNSTVIGKYEYDLFLLLNDVKKYN